MEEKKEMTIEETFKALEAILEDLDSEQKGLEYVRSLQSKIDGIEKKLIVLENGNGEEND